MIDAKIQEAFSKAFGIRRFAEGYHGIKNEVDPTSKSLHFWIDHLWAVNISFYYYAPVIIAGIRYASDDTKSERLHRVGLLVEANASPYTYKPDMPEEN